MPLVLRQIKPQKWTEEDPLWQQRGDCPADAIGDLRTTEKKLSVWYVKDDKSNLNDIIIGITANFQYLNKLDFTLISQDIIERKGFKIYENKGATPYQEAKEWHRDIEIQSARKLIILSKLIKNHLDIDRRDEDELVEFLTNAVNLGKLKVQKLRGKIKDTIEQKL